MSTEGKNSSHLNSNKNSTSTSSGTDWKLKINDLVQTCQAEIKKTTKIGIKMLSASQSSAHLHDTYEDLGKWLFSQVKTGKISVDDEKIQNLINRINELEAQLESYEKDVQDIKSSDSSHQV